MAENEKNGRIGEQEFTYHVPTGRYTEHGQPEFYRKPPKASAQDKPKQSPKSQKAPPLDKDGEPLAF